MDIELYINSVYSGFHSTEIIEKYFDKYREMALSRSETIGLDEVILYAVYAYDHTTNGIISTDFMLLEMSYGQYEDLCAELSKNCRLFFVSRRQEDNYEKK